MNHPLVIPKSCKDKSGLRLSNDVTKMTRDGFEVRRWNVLPSIVVNAGPAFLQHSPHISVLSAQTIRSATVRPPRSISDLFGEISTYHAGMDHMN